MQNSLNKWSHLNVVLCHDWLTGMRGGERVLEILCKAFPDAPILTLIHNASAISPTINAHRVIPSRLQRIPGVFRHYRSMLPLMPSAIEALRVPPCDLVISTSHCVAKSIVPPSGAKHLCYCFTPMRYAWTFFDEYFGGNPLKAAVARPLLGRLRKWDRRTAHRVHRFVAISQHVQTRIGEFYGREADVVYPPVDTERCTPGNTPPEEFDLIVSALVPYKRLDLAVRAYARMDYPVKIVGIGGESARLEALAGGKVEFLGWQTDDVVLDLYRRCRLLVFPGEEDFGIVPLEAQACGRPVVAFRRGGALETIRENETGIFFDAQEEDALIEAVQRAGARDWDPAVIRAHAESFGVPRFAQGLSDSIARVM